MLTSRKRHPSVGCCLPLKAARCHSGAPGLVRFSVMKKNNAAALQTGPRLFPECQRPLTVILMVPVFFDITIVCVKFAEYPIAKVIPRQRRNGTVSNTAESPVGSRPLCEDRPNVVRQLYFSKIAVRSAIRSTLLTAERLAAASEGRTSYIA